jgi:hypothetical protein
MRLRLASVLMMMLLTPCQISAQTDVCGPFMTVLNVAIASARAEDDSFSQYKGAPVGGNEGFDYYEAEGLSFPGEPSCAYSHKDTDREVDRVQCFWFVKSRDEAINGARALIKALNGCLRAADVGEFESGKSKSYAPVQAEALISEKRIIAVEIQAQDTTRTSVDWDLTGSMVRSHAGQRATVISLKITVLERTST